VRQAKAPVPRVAPPPIDPLELVEGLPYGILVTDEEGVIIQYNPAAVELLGDRVAEAGASCCRLLGCGTGALGGHCLTRLANERGSRLPEVRVDLVHEDGARAAWVTAAELDADDRLVVLHLRPADPGDRRRRTTPHWTAGPQLRVTSLGETRVDSLEGPLTGEWLRQRPGQVLKYLLCERARVVPAEQMAAALWPEGGLKALNSVRHCVHAVRDRLEPTRAKRAPSSFLVSHGGGYGLDLNRVHIDADRFKQHVHTGVAAFTRGEGAVTVDSLQEGLDLYGGAFLLDEPYADWAVGERDRLRGLAARAHRLLAELALRGDDLDAALDQVQRLAELEPLDHEVQWALLTLFLRRGRRSEAVRRFGLLRQRMLREFGEEPDFELSDVADAAERPLRLA